MNIQKINKMKHIVMKRFFNYIALAFVMVGAMSIVSCDVDSSPNGKLDGYWRMQQIDTLATEGVCELDGELLFWSIQNKLLQFVDRKNETTPYYLRFEHSGNTLELSSPFIDKSQSEDIPLEDINVLKKYGVSSIPISFKIETLSSKSLVLSTQHIRLTLKRY